VETLNLAKNLEEEGAGSKGVKGMEEGMDVTAIGWAEEVDNQSEEEMEGVTP